MLPTKKSVYTYVLFWQSFSRTGLCACKNVSVFSYWRRLQPAKVRCGFIFLSPEPTRDSFFPDNPSHSIYSIYSKYK